MSAKKQWWTKLVFEDLDHDCGSLSLAARGAWVWIFEYLKHHNGRQVHDLSGWARVVRASNTQTATVLAELFRRKTCDWDMLRDGVTLSVTPENVTRDALIQNSDAQCDVRCRRQIKTLNHNLKHRLRQQRYRGRKARDAPCDAGVTPIELEVSSDAPLPPPKKAGGNGHLGPASMFEVCLASWPPHRRGTRKEVFEAFLRLKPDTPTFDRIMAAIEILKESQEWKREDGRYIPKLADWLEVRGFEGIGVVQQEPEPVAAGSDPRPPSGMDWARDESGEVIHPLRLVAL